MENNSNLLSVIIPVYKAGDFIWKSSGSILKSSYTNIELILVDDGSPDESGSICDKIAETDSRVRVVHKENGGISSARNTGIKVANGSYIAFVDQDDSVRSDMYERLIGKAEEGFDIVISDFLLVYPERETVYKTFDIHPDHDDTYRDMILKGYGCNIWNMVIRKKVVTENEISFPEHLKHCEDVWFSLRLHLYTDKIAKIDEPFYIYNLANPKQVSANLDERFTQCEMQCIDETLPVIATKGKLEDFKKELYWLMLQLKTNWIFDSTKYELYQKWHPEANAYVNTCPLLSSKMKIAMWCLNHRFYFPVRIMAKVYKVKQRL